MYNNDNIFILTAQDFRSLEMMIGHLNQTLWELFSARRVTNSDNPSNKGKHMIAFYNERKALQERIEQKKPS